MILHKNTNQFLLDRISVSTNPGIVLSLILIKTSPVISWFLCTEIYFPFPWEWSSYPLHKLRGLFRPLLQRVDADPLLVILHTWVGIIWSLVANITVPDFKLRKLWHPQSTSLALKADPSFTGIKVTSSSVQVIFRLYFCRNNISRFTLWLNPHITKGSRT